MIFAFLKLSSRTGGGDRGDGCCDAATICGLGVDIDAIGTKSDDIFSRCSLSPIIGSLQSTIFNAVPLNLSSYFCKFRSFICEYDQF